MLKLLIKKTSAIGITGVLLLGLSGYLAHTHQFFELTVHFKLQYFVLSCGLTLILLLLGNRLFSILGCVAILLNGIDLSPYYLEERLPEVSNYKPLRVMLSNVQTANSDYQKIIVYIDKNKPDFVIFQEINNTWAQKLQTNLPQYPYRTIKAREDNFGIALFSKIPFQHSEIINLGMTGLPSIFVRIKTEDIALSMLATHPLPPVSKAYFLARNDQLHEIGLFIKKQKGPIILAGDLNITRWSPYYRDLEKQAMLKNARNGFGIYPTWPSWFPLLLIPIDHCLISKDIAIKNFTTGPDIGSDHYPVLIDLLIPPNQLQ